jgi:hypothetical protein
VAGRAHHRVSEPSNEKLGHLDSFVCQTRMDEKLLILGIEFNECLLSAWLICIGATGVREYNKCSKATEKPRKQPNHSNPTHTIPYHWAYYDRHTSSVEASPKPVHRGWPDCAFVP